MKLFDSHSHLNDEKFNDDRKQVISQIINSGVSNFITAGYDLESSKHAVDMANEYEFIYATVGISPNDIPQEEEKLWKQLDEIKQLAENNKKVIAIGEIGLDYYWNKENEELQKKAFIEQIKIANDLNLPIVIHTRDAVMDTLKILKENEVKNKGVFHCCPQNRELIKEGLKLGFYISFAGPITFKSSKNAEEMINLVPNDKLLIETDSPYLAPEPVRGTRNTPANVKFVAQKIADAKGLDVEKVAEFTNNNAYTLFKIKKQAGITIITLVITIIILLILAGISITALTGKEGIITKAKQAKEQAENAQAQENEILENVLISMNENYDDKEETDKSQLTDEFKEYLKTIVDDATSKKILDAYPVGSVYISTNDKNPSEFIGGTWEEYGQGKTIIGAGTGTDTNSETQTFSANTTGGEYKHKLNISEMPKHTHAMRVWVPYAFQSECISSGKWVGAAGIKADSWNVENTGVYEENGDIQGGGSGPLYTGGSESHNNVQPYIVTYMWKRIN